MKEILYVCLRALTVDPGNMTVTDSRQVSNWVFPHLYMSPWTARVPFRSCKQVETWKLRNVLCSGICPKKPTVIVFIFHQSNLLTVFTKWNSSFHLVHTAVFSKTYHSLSTHKLSIYCTLSSIYSHCSAK